MKLYFNTGTMYLDVVEVEGNVNDDIAGIAEAYVMDHKDEFQTFTYEELTEGLDEEEMEYWDELFMAINGGEYYVYNLARVEA